jgi:hypothetical protein
MTYWVFHSVVNLNHSTHNSKQFSSLLRLMNLLLFWQSLQHASFSFATQFIVYIELYKSLRTQSCRSVDATCTCWPRYWLVLIVSGRWVFLICTTISRAPPHLHAHTTSPSSSGKPKEGEGCRNYSSSLTATAALGERSVDLISVWKYENLRTQLQDWTE